MSEKDKQPLTKGFVQLGHDVETIISSAHPSFGSGRRNAIGLLFFNLAFSY